MIRNSYSYMDHKFINILNSLLVLLCLTALFGGLVYRFYSLNSLGTAISLTLAVISFVIIHYWRIYANKNNRLPEYQLDGRPNEKNSNNSFGLINFLLLAAYVLLVLFSFYILFSHRTDGSIISPWQVVPKYFFIVYTLTSLSLIGNIIKNEKITLPLISLHYFLSFSVALIVYRLGYGYDQFIHLATEDLIAKTGAVEPRPWYYLGQYGLVVILYKITALPLVWFDRLLVPLAAAVFLPATLWRVLTVWFSDKRLNLLLIFSLLALTFPWLIVTTPQNLAYALLIIVILLGLICKNFHDLLAIALLALTALIIQPIAGLPALLFSALLAVYHSDKNKMKAWLYSATALIAIFILPLSFYLLEKSAAPAAGLAKPAGGVIKNSLFEQAGVPGGENFILNFIYLYGFNLGLILLLLILSGLIIAWKFRPLCRIFFLYLVVSLSLSVSYFLTSKISFSFLIDYERGDYPERILLTAGVFLLPFIMISFYALGEKILAQNLAFKLSWAVFLALLVSAALYLSYPRFDNYFNSHGFSVSRSDLNAVNWINENSTDDFIVLANQQVGAAALNQFGFKKYYLIGPNKNTELFYYPIPTGSPLYQYYLSMVYDQPSRATMLEAMDLAGVNEGYFVLNKYWRAFVKILAEAKLSASSWQAIDNGEVYVFKYEKK